MFGRLVVRSFGRLVGWSVGLFAWVLGCLFACWVLEGPGSGPRGPKTSPRRPQHGLERPQEAPKTAQEAPWGVPGASWKGPGRVRETLWILRHKKEGPPSILGPILGRLGAQVGTPNRSNTAPKKLQNLAQIFTSSWTPLRAVVAPNLGPMTAPR